MSNIFEMKSKEKTVETVEKNETKLLRNWYIWAIVMAGLSSFLLIVIFWCTNVLQNGILSNLIIKNGTRAFDFWSNPPVKLVRNYYIYNYTNTDDFESGKANKLKVQQLGPYIYRETLTRINTQIHENGTITYQEKRSYEWEGGNPEDDVIIAPNILLLMVTSTARNFHYTGQLMFVIAMYTIKIKPFIKVTVGDYLWGYDDSLYNILKTFGLLQNSAEKFAIQTKTNEIWKDRLMISTGSDDLNNIGIVLGVNGKNYLNIWGDEECDKVDGTDGSIFPRNWIKNQSIPLRLYIKELCKSMLFNFHEYSQVQGIPSLKYKLSMDSFQVSTKETCFCPKIDVNSEERKCPPSGTINVTKCFDNLPVIFSLPHFYGAEKSLIESIDGLKPEQNLHESSLELHQFLAVPMNGTMRLQLNLEVKKVFDTSYRNLSDGTLLPIFWNEVTLDVLPQDFIDIFYNAYFTITFVEVAFRWGSILIFLCSICALYVARRHHQIQRSNV
ncbi:hypothetical protein M0802_004112 [Mischocyttarus mexicanus]|nr:hypothetical protein M0802_004112 [Mischocyttarus mexicanus]